MAKDITDPQLARELQREYGLRGLLEPLVLSPVVVPVCITSDLRRNDIWADSPYARRFAKAGTGAGDATHPFTGWLVNPTTSSSIAVVRKILLNTGSGAVPGRMDLFYYSQSSLVATSTFTGVPLNRRAPGESQATVKFANNIAVLPADAPGTLATVDFITNVTPVTLEGLDIVVPPGIPGGTTFQLVIQGSANAGTASVTFFWDEIPLTQA